MSNDLDIRKESVVSLIEDRNLSDIIKPLVREIHLFDSYIAGTTFLKDKAVLDEIKEGDELTLQREDNKFDSNAVLINTIDKRKLGYVPEKDNIVFARLMDAGKLLKAKITSIKQRGSFNQIGIGIFLVDF